MTIAPPMSPHAPSLQPHRGTTVLVLGILGLVINGCGFGWILGVIAWVMGAGDLRSMRAGRMDPSGKGMTQAGMICGIVSVSIAALLLLFYVVMVLFFGGLAILGGAAAGAGGP
ncbi:MAG TPA: hypothetical protein VFF69_02125 [Phycisphaerales bacterium]|nr:hypothetical protein [Phycisphaerales bacterium]